MKHVSESLSQYFDHSIFRLLEEKSETSDLKEKEKDGLAVIDKLKKNFEEFKKDAKGQIGKFKTFWEENQKTKEAFTETGDVYKMFDDNYVAGVLELPMETLSDGSIEGGMGAIDEPDEEIIEGKEIEGSEMNEAEEEDDLGLGDLDDMFGDEEEESEMLEPPAEGDSLEKPAEPIETDEDPAADIDLDAEPEMDTDEPSLSEPQKYFVVYDISGDEREEIFRCGSNNVVNAFNEFYTDMFKGSMKDAILKYKEKKQEEKAKAEKSEKEKVQKEKQSKIKKFLGESIIYEDLEDTELIPEDAEEDEEMNEWYEQVHLYLVKDFEFSPEEADNFMLIVDEELMGLNEEGADPFSAAQIVADNDEALQELYSEDNEYYEDYHKEFNEPNEDFNNEDDYEDDDAEYEEDEMY